MVTKSGKGSQRVTKGEQGLQRVRLQSVYLEDLREHEEAATAEGGLLLLGHLQQALGKSRHPATGDIGLHGLEQQAQEQGRLAGPGHLWVQQYSIQRPAHIPHLAVSMHPHSWRVLYIPTAGGYCTSPQLTVTIPPHSWRLLCIRTAGVYCTSPQLADTVHPHSWRILYIPTAGDFCASPQLVATVHPHSLRLLCISTAGSYYTS